MSRTRHVKHYSHGQAMSRIREFLEECLCENRLDTTGDDQQEVAVTAILVDELNGLKEKLAAVCR